jgi:hypothetical protein
MPWSSISAQPAPRSTNLDRVLDAAAFRTHLLRRLEEEGATVGIGRYAEPRVCYASDDYAQAAGEFPERRTVHTAIDIFLPVGSPVLTRRIYRGSMEDGAGDVHGDWSPERHFWTAQTLVWCFLMVNVVGYATWYLYPAEPPWYIEAYGLKTVLLDVPGSPARTARFDNLLGTRFFAWMYGYESNPLGAIPSLHISYPMLSVFFAFRLGALRTLTVAFLAVMCFAAVYLNHHYVIDVVLGVLYGLVAGVMTVAGAEWAITSSSFRPSRERR